MLLLRVNGGNGKTSSPGAPAPTTAVDLFPVHLDEITHMQFMPNGKELVSLSKDGTGRLTSVKNGSTKGKFEVPGRANPKLLQVSPDGKLVVSVWGYDVMMWYPSTGQTTSYNLNTVRRNEAQRAARSAPRGSAGRIHAQRRARRRHRARHHL